MNLTRWLARHKPAKVMCELRTGESRAVNVPNHGKRWAATMETIASLDATKITLFDAGDTILSSVNLETNPDADPVAELEKASAQEDPANTIARAMPAILNAVGGMVREQMNMQAEERRYVFDAIVSLANSSNQRAIAYEKAWQQMLMERAEERAASGADPTDAMAMDFLGKVVAGQAAPTASAASATSSTSASGASAATSTNGTNGKKKKE